MFFFADIGRKREKGRLGHSWILRDLRGGYIFFFRFVEISLVLDCQRPYKKIVNPTRFLVGWHVLRDRL